MSGTTSELNLPTAQDGDDLEAYLTSGTIGLAFALTVLDALFSATTGHDHSAAHEGKPISAAGLAEPLTLTGPTLTNPTITGAIDGGATIGNPTFSGVVKGQTGWFDPVMLVHI